MTPISQTEITAYNEEFHRAYAGLVNRLTQDFMRDYCDAMGAIRWEQLVAHVSKRSTETPHPFDGESA